LENKYKLHHTFWCINIDSADTGGLFTRDEGTPFPGGRDLKWNDNKYDNYLYPVLWKTEDGKFIGLDHKIPLGRNGISISQLSNYTPSVTPSPSATPSPTTITAPPTDYRYIRRCERRRKGKLQRCGIVEKIFVGFG